MARARRRWTPKKKAKTYNTTPVYHEVEKILKEERDERGLWYLVEWAGVNPRTSSPWRPTWIHSAGMDADWLIEKWQDEKLNQEHGRNLQTCDSL
jgi:hypothetical protein